MRRAPAPALRAAVDELGEEQAALLRPLLDLVERTPPLRLEQEYVETFDLRRRCALYLTYNAFGDTRKRGMAC